MRVLVTGGTGFLGQHIATTLSNAGWQVTVLGRNRRIGNEHAHHGRRFVCADLANASAVSEAVAGQDVVVHSGALASPWGPYRQFYRANVQGTRSVVEAALAHGVRRFVHISTPSLYVDGEHQHHVREEAALPQKLINHYATTKKLAEDVVDDAVERGLSALTLRPQALFGPGDRAILPRILKAARRGRVPIIGDGTQELDVTYVGNVVDAVVRSIEAPQSLTGRKYNVTNGEPMAVRVLLERLFERLGRPFVPRHLPFRFAYGLAGAMEQMAKLTGGWEPPLTRYSVIALGRSRTLCLDAIQRDLDYHPRVSVEEGLERFATWWQKVEGGADPSGIN